MRKRNNAYEEHLNQMVENMSAKDITALITWGGGMYNAGVKDACKVVIACGLAGMAVAGIDYLMTKKKEEKSQETTRENPTV